MEMQRPLIIAFASPKGGVGKSTSCLNIGGSLAAAGHPVHIMDLDQTQTLGRWYETHAGSLKTTTPLLTVATCKEADFPAAFKAALHERLTAGGFILLDLAGNFDDTMLKAAALADLTISPAKVSESDVVEATKLSERITNLAAQVGKVIRHRVLFNEVPSLLPAFMVHVLGQLHRSASRCHARTKARQSL